MRSDPLEDRLQDPIFAKAYDAFLQVVADRARPDERRKGMLRVSIPEADSLSVTRRSATRQAG